MMDRITRARELRAMIETNAQSMEPAKMAEYPELFPEWVGDGREYPAGKILRRNGELFKVNNGMGHRSQPDWTPESAHSLFSKLLTDPTGKTIQPWVRPDSTNGYAHLAEVTHNGDEWVNTLADIPNTWEPGVFGWMKKSEYLASLA